ncbi:hypothetical protein [Serratia marcescens]
MIGPNGPLAPVERHDHRDPHHLSRFGERHDVMFQRRAVHITHAGDQADLMVNQQQYRVVAIQQLQRARRLLRLSMWL